ncbi:hypothetical protein ElyMa_003935000 [Elysia marginata]|uniref:SOCS box domain-containing protein n=1 Tax=Elysia marginata TaxID=1093978 RepID=A0AAV4FSZ1_9GAST|nr:hypothetical protein ElyMa_003935000 [Elysia marginata]
MIAVLLEFGEALTLLLHKGAFVNTISQHGFTPMSESSLDHAIQLLRQGFDPALSRRDRHIFHYAVDFGRRSLVRGFLMNGFPPLDLGIEYKLTNGQNKCKVMSPLSIAMINRRVDLAKFLIANRFLTVRYDTVQLYWNSELLGHLSHHCKNGDIEAKKCLEILRVLSSQPRTLRNLCLSAVSSALSGHMLLPVLFLKVKKPVGQRFWKCSSTFKETVQRLEIPTILKRVLMHQTPSSAICCQLWGEIDLWEEKRYTISSSDTSRSLSERYVFRLEWTHVASCSIPKSKKTNRTALLEMFANIQRDGAAFRNTHHLRKRTHAPNTIFCNLLPIMG